MKKHSTIYTSARPYIACFAVLRDGDKIAMVKRRNTGWMDGFYGLPAGKVEFGEPYTLAAMREAKEEAGVDIALEDLEFAHIVHRHKEDETETEFMDWVDVYFEANKWTGEPHNAEEAKAESLDWIDMNDMPENIVPPVLDALQRIAKGEKYSEYGW